MEKLGTFQIILLAVFAFAAVTGLYLFANFGGFGGSKVQIGVVSIWGPLPQTAMQASLDALALTDSEAYKNVSYSEKPVATFSAELADALAAGVGPDLVIMSQELLNAEQNKLQLISFDALPERTFLDAYLPLFELFLTPEGSYGVPLVLDPLILYYNRTSLSSAGITSPPVSWEAVSGFVPYLTERDAAGAIGKSTIALGDYTNVHSARAILSLFLLQAGSPVTETTAQGVRSALAGERAEGATPAESAVRFYTEFADPAKTVYSWNRSLEDSQQGFIAGDNALYLGFASELPYMQSANPNLDFDIARIPQPATALGRSTYGIGYAFAIPKQSKNPAGAFTVATAIANSPDVLTLADALSMIPAQRTLISYGNGRFTSVYYPEGLTAKGWLSPAPSVTDGIFSGMIGNITSGRQDIPDAIHTADQSLNASLR